MPDLITTTNLAGCRSCDDIGFDLLDRPYRPHQNGKLMARQIGITLGLPPSAIVSKDDGPSQVMVRASNLATLTAAVLLKFKPAVRQDVLVDLGGQNWTTKVLKLAGQMPGGFGISDAVRFSLAMHYMLGLLQSERGEDTDEARVYRLAVERFHESEQRVKSGTPTPRPAPTGVAGVVELAGFGQLGGFFDDVGNAFKSAADTVVGAVRGAGESIQKAVDFGVDILCKGMKKILGDTIGGVICWLTGKGLQVMVSSAKMLIEITATSIESFVDFIRNLAAGKIMEAIKSLMMGVTRTLFLLFLPVSEPFFGIKADKLKEVGDRVSKRAPFFPLALVMAIIGIVPVPKPAGISALVLALSPAIAVLVAPALAPLLKWTLEKAEDCIEKFVKIVLVVVQGFMALTDILPRLKTQVASYIQKKGGVGGALSAAAGSVTDKFKAQWTKLTDALAKGKLKDVASLIGTLVALLPDLFGGLMEETNESIPAFSETVSAIKDSVKSVDEQDAKLKAAQAQVVAQLSPKARQTVAMDNARALDPEAAGAHVATVFYENDRDPKKAEAFRRGFQSTAQKLATA